MKSKSTTSDNQHQTVISTAHQAKKPDERTTEAGYQKLPPQGRAGAARSHPLITLGLAICQIQLSQFPEFAPKAPARETKTVSSGNPPREPTPRLRDPKPGCANRHQSRANPNQVAQTITRAARTKTRLRGPSPEPREPKPSCADRRQSCANQKQAAQAA